MKRFLQLLAFSPVLFACTANNAVKTDPQPQSAASELVSFYQQGCRGYCPTYKVWIFNDGRARYEGIRFVTTVGNQEFQASPAEMDQLRAAVERANLWSLPNTIATDIADLPYSTLTVYRNGETHAVSASANKPEGFIALEERIKEVLEAHGLQVREGVNPDAIPEEAKRQLIVTLKPEINAGNWITDFDEPKMLLERRLAETNQWLVVYDSRSITVADVITLVKAHPAVISVKTP